MDDTLNLSQLQLITPIINVEHTQLLTQANHSVKGFDGKVHLTI